MSSDNGPRIFLAALAFSAVGLVGLTDQEGWMGKAGIPVKGDKPTIGFGTTEGVKVGDTITPPQALARALKDVQKFEGALKKCVTVPLHQHEYDAYVSLAYNIGPTAFCGSTLVKRLNASDYRGACSEILRWRFYQGKDCSLDENKRLCGGIWTRRMQESSQCAGGAL
jgi:lysozyme